MPPPEIINLQTAVKPVLPGKVWLVGAGPGEPDLLTVKALRVIQQADVILYDNLVSEAIRELFPAATPSFYVGKLKDAHSIPQERLNALLIEKAKEGSNVCRIKGGDPFVFGRGGEEMLTLKAAGIEVELVPGITAAAGCTSYAGIPLTHRGVSQGCTLVTAHGEKSLDLNWQALASLQHTVVFYMGLSRAAMIRDELMRFGLNKETPVAVIESGCCPNQRLFRGALSELPELVVNHNIQSPALIVVGEVTRLADQLDWFVSQANESINREPNVKKISA